MLFNLSIGITIAMFPGLFDQVERRGGLEYDSSFTTQFEKDVNGTVKPYTDVQAQESTFQLILDKLGIGVLVKFLASLDKYLYGFVHFIDAIFGSMFVGNQALRWIILNGLRFIITLSYIIGAVELWSTRRTLITPGT